MKKQRKESTRVPLSDEKIIELYWQRDENAIKETDFKYKSYLYTVAYNIVNDSLDCEECLNDTYIGTWNAIPPAKPNFFKAFLTTIIRRIAVNRYHRNQRKSVVPSEMTSSLSEIEYLVTDSKSAYEDYDDRRLGQVISDFVFSLPKRKRFIFMSRYYVAEPLDIIAKELSVSKSTVKKELASIKAMLKEKLEKEGYSL